MRLRRPAYSLTALATCVTIAALIAFAVRQAYWQPEFHWKPFSQAEITAANARGQIVVVSFKADW